MHEGAIYLHMGRSYQVLELDLAGRRALLDPFDGDYFTQAKREIMIYITRMQGQRETCGVTLSFGDIVYAETVLGYQRKRLQDHEVIDFQTLDLPTVEFSTRALWYELDELIAAEPFPPERLLGALHALEHGQIAVLPLIAMCDRWDIGGLSTNAAPPDRWPDDLHLRRTSGRRRDHPPRLRRVRAPGRGRKAADRRVPVPLRLPVVRAVAEVRQPERAAVQARRPRAAAAASGAALNAFGDVNSSSRAHPGAER